MATNNEDASSGSQSGRPGTSSSNGTSPTRSTIIRLASVSEEFQDSGFVRIEPDRLPPRGSTSELRTEVDIIAIPAIGAHPIDSWIGPRAFSEQQDADAQPVSSQSQGHQGSSSHSRRSQSLRRSRHSNAHQEVSPASTKKTPWVIHDIRKTMREGRVLLYNHGMPQDGNMIQTYADDFLQHLMSLRRREGEERPLLFICHSTGGLVAKAALIKIKENPEFESVLARCFGVVFLATPHLGSSYLASTSFSTTVAKALNLVWYLPESTQAELLVNHKTLLNLSVRFRSAAADLKIWTFWETEDTDLTNDTGTVEEKLFFHAPIASKISAILKLRCEDAYPLISDHAGCAAFGGDNVHSKPVFLLELESLAQTAIKLCQEGHVALKLKDLVDVEIHGFFEEDSIASTDAKSKLIRMYTSKKKLNEFLELGPERCVRERLAENTPYPEMVRFSRAVSRAKSLNIEQLPRNESPGQDSSSRLQKENRPPEAPKSQYLTIMDPDMKREPSDLDEERWEERRRSVIGPTHHDELAEEGQQHPRTRVIPPTPVSRPIPTIDVPSMLDQGLRKANLQNTPRPVSRIASGPTTVTTEAKTADNLQGQGLQVTGGSLMPTKPGLPRINTRQRSTSPGRRGSHSHRHHHAPPQPGRLSQRAKKITWIHVPYNNPPWVSDVLGAIGKDQFNEPRSKLLQNRFWSNRHIWAKHTEHHACYVEPGCILVQPDTDSSPTSSPEDTFSSQPGSETSLPFAKNAEVQLSLYLPYLHWDTYKKMVERRTIIKERLERGRARPLPPDVGQLESLEHKVAWMYLAYSPPFNCRRTLDQYGYPHLNDTRARDDDQMLYKMTKERDVEDDTADPNEDLQLSEDEVDENNPGVRRERKMKEIDELKDGKVLMVDQLWLFITDKNTVATFFPKRHGSPDEEKVYQQMDLRNSIYSEVNADLSTRCETAVDLAGVIALHAINLMFRRDTIHELQVFRVFEESVSILVEKMTKSFKYFRAKGFRATDENTEDEKESNIIRRHKREGEQFQAQIRDNTSALLELRDIADELKTLAKLFEQQHQALQKMKNWYRTLGYKNTVGYDALDHAMRKLSEYKEKMQDMLNRAEEAKTDFEKLLELIQRQANVDEARLTRWQADLTNSQTRALNIFTVFTVIFLPLSFFTSVFGMNTEEFTNGGYMNLPRIALWSLPISAGLIIGTFILAFSTTIRSAAMYIFVKLPTQPLEKYDPAVEAWEERHRRDKARRKEKLRKFRETSSTVTGSGYRSSMQGDSKWRLRRFHHKHHYNDYAEVDFWEEHRAAAASAGQTGLPCTPGTTGGGNAASDIYEIPNLNRKRSAMPPMAYGAHPTHYSDSSDRSRPFEKNQRSLGQALFAKLFNGREKKNCDEHDAGRQNGNAA